MRSQTENPEAIAEKISISGPSKMPDCEKVNGKESTPPPTIVETRLNTDVAASICRLLLVYGVWKNSNEPDRSVRRSACREYLAARRTTSGELTDPISGRSRPP